MFKPNLIQVQKTSNLKQELKLDISCIDNTDLLAGSFDIFPGISMLPRLSHNNS